MPQRLDKRQSKRLSPCLLLFRQLKLSPLVEPKVDLCFDSTTGALVRLIRKL